MKIKSCVVTGCAGFIASHLTQKLLESGVYVYGIDKLGYASHKSRISDFLQKYPQLFKFDHLDINDLKYLPDVDVIFNLAAESSVEISIERSSEFIKSNVNGVHNLLELLRFKNEKILLVHASTDEVYADIVEGSHTEKDNLNPSNPYSASKACSDLLIKSYSRTYGIEFKILRPTNTFGIYQNTEKLIPKACKRLSLGKTIPLHNNGSPVRTWLHVSDCVNAFIHVAQNGLLNNIYNVSGSYQDTNINVVKKIIKCFFGQNENYEKHLDFSYSRIGQDVRYSLDFSKIRAIGWDNEKKFDEELPAIVEFYKNNFIW